MRVISQDGTMDFPYEMSIVWCEDAGSVLLQPIGETGEYQTFAKYSTEEKAKKAMEMLRDAYIGTPIVMRNVDVSEDVAREFERLKKCGIMVRTENQPSKIECISNAIFQFPAEEELE
ncbi:MAG: hypothetical protein ACLSXG_01775 [Roseburia faecis]|jgi:hypothetical protein|nr:MAG TPA: hypothetical protein [Caudoviricetes sp.]